MIYPQQQKKVVMRKLSHMQMGGMVAALLAGVPRIPVLALQGDRTGSRTRAVRGAKR
jgi:hypothetical protein